MKVCFQQIIFKIKSTIRARFLIGIRTKIQTKYFNQKKYCFVKLLLIYIDFENKEIALKMDHIDNIIEQESLESKLRREALIRKPQFTYPQITFNHDPINVRQCMQLQEQLSNQTKITSQIVKTHHDVQQTAKQYQKRYSQFAQMDQRDEQREKRICKDIKQMHEMADMLLNAPTLENQLYLFSRQQPTQAEKAQIQATFLQYQKAYKNNQSVQESQAEQAIRRAKVYLLRNCEDVV